MTTTRAQPGDLIDIQPLGQQLADHKTESLLKTDQLEVIRLVLPRGKSLAEHQAPGDITVQCLEGRISFTCLGKTQTLAPGRLLSLLAGQPHALEACENSTVLLTICRSPR